MTNPSIEAAFRASRSQRSWGFAVLLAALTGTVMAASTGEGYWWLLAALFALVGLTLVGTAKGRVKLAIAMRAAHMQTARGFRGTAETRTDGADAFTAAVTMVAQAPGLSLDQAFDFALDQILTRRGY